MEQITFEYLINNIKIEKYNDKLKQKKEMDRLNRAIDNISTGMYIKANMIANKAISTKFGYSKTLKKNQMSIDMLKERQKILEQVISLMIAKELGIDIPHISDVIYSQYSQKCRG